MKDLNDLHLQCLSATRSLTRGQEAFCEQVALWTTVIKGPCIATVACWQSISTLRILLPTIFIQVIHCNTQLPTSTSTHGELELLLWFSSFVTVTLKGLNGSRSEN